MRRQALTCSPHSRIKAHRPLGMTECPLRCQGFTALDSICISGPFQMDAGHLTRQPLA